MRQLVLLHAIGRYAGEMIVANQNAQQNRGFQVMAMAGGEGFEPPGRLHAHRFSRPEQSTTLPPTRQGRDVASPACGRKMRVGAFGLGTRIVTEERG